MAYSDACKLCLSTASAVDQQIVCFGTLLPAAASTGTEDGTRIKCTVAEVLTKHFWFESQCDSDAEAFVCQTCWTKVYDFHQFYESVRIRYENRSLSFSPKPTDLEQCFINETLQITMHDDTQKSFDVKCVANNLSGSDDWDHWNGDKRDRSEDDGDDDDNNDDDVESLYDDNNADESEISAQTKHKTGHHRRRRSYNRSAVSIKVETNSTDQQHHADDVQASNTGPPDEAADQKLFEQYFTLQCDLCSEPIATLLDARAHYQRVHKQRGYLSCGCGRRFTRDAAIREHCKFHVHPSPHKCIECCRIFSNAAWLASHNRCKHSLDGLQPPPPVDMIMNTDAIAKKMPHCKVLQRRNDELLRRYMSMVCDLCGDAFDTFEEAIQHHEQQHAGPGYVICCGKKYKKKPRAVLHCHWHENPRQFDCKECGRNFTGVECLRRHVGDHHPSSELPFCHPCDECDRSFQQPSQLRNHKRLKHTPKDAMRFECYVCHKRYRCLSYLRYHLRDVHYSTGPSHVCDVCAKSFQSKNSYELHYAVEHGTESLRRQCPECGKWLKHARCLKSHIKLNHSDGGPPVACDQCAYVARNARALYSHRRFTHCEPAYKCLVCDKRFKTKTVLREHSAIHTGITDLYKCSYCAQTFRSGANMYKHRREKHAAQWEMDKRMAHSIVDEQNIATTATVMNAGWK